MNNKSCRACLHVIDDDDDDADELGLCPLCRELNELAHEFGYDEIRRALPLLEELGNREERAMSDKTNQTVEVPQTGHRVQVTSAGVWLTEGLDSIRLGNTLDEALDNLVDDLNAVSRLRRERGRQ